MFRRALLPRLDDCDRRDCDYVPCRSLSSCHSLLVRGSLSAQVTQHKSTSNEWPLLVSVFGSTPARPSAANRRCRSNAVLLLLLPGDDSAEAKGDSTLHQLMNRSFKSPGIEHSLIILPHHGTLFSASFSPRSLSDIGATNRATLALRTLHRGLFPIKGPSKERTSSNSLC